MCVNQQKKSEYELKFCYEYTNPKGPESDSCLSPCQAVEGFISGVHLQML